MTLFNNKYRVESARLKGWDYSKAGIYFLTVCTKNREPYFGHIKDGKMVLSETGKNADKCWREIPAHFPFAVLDEYVVMPDHLHGIIIVETQNFASLQLKKPTANGKFGPQSMNIPSIIRGFKIGVKKWAVLNKIEFYWQSRYHDHIIRDEKDLHHHREYILNNPSNWNIDEEN